MESGKLAIIISSDECSAHRSIPGKRGEETMVIRRFGGNEELRVTKWWKYKDYYIIDINSILSNKHPGGDTSMSILDKIDRGDRLNGDSRHGPNYGTGHLRIIPLRDNPYYRTAGWTMESIE
jgi:hypothetical protein